MNRTSTIVLLVTLLLLLGVADRFVGASSSGLRSRPHIRCSACHALAEIIADKMNETSRLRTSIQNSHRLGVDNKPRRIDYETSELRAIEIMEKICDNFKDKDYKLREGANTVRLVSKNDSLPSAHYYGKDDKDKLSNFAAKLKDVCYELVDDHDEAIVATIRKERTLEAVTDTICRKVSKVCGTKAVDAAVKEELQLRSTWEVRRQERAAKKKAQQEVEEAEQRAKDEADRIKKEAEAGFQWRGEESLNAMEEIQQEQQKANQEQDSGSANKEEQEQQQQQQQQASSEGKTEL